MLRQELQRLKDAAVRLGKEATVQLKEAGTQEKEGEHRDRLDAPDRRESDLARARLSQEGPCQQVQHRGAGDAQAGQTAKLTSSKRSLCSSKVSGTWPRMKAGMGSSSC